MLEILFPGISTYKRLMVIKRILDSQKKKEKAEEAAEQSFRARSLRENTDGEKQEE